MHTLMGDQSTLPTESLITYPTGVWPLPTMYELMLHQMNLPTERLITYPTGV